LIKPLLIDMTKNTFDKYRDNINKSYYSTPDNIISNLATNFETITMSTDNESILFHNNRITNEITNSIKHTIYIESSD